MGELEDIISKFKAGYKMSSECLVYLFEGSTSDYMGRMHEQRLNAFLTELQDEEDDFWERQGFVVGWFFTVLKYPKKAYSNWKEKEKVKKRY